jgi:peptidoglycan hydrolase-like protein with peptidoglycan-binding domain
MIKWIVLTLALVFAPSSYADYRVQAEVLESQYQLPYGLLSAICKVESNGNTAAVGLHGEIGLCQVKPDTVKVFCPSCAQRVDTIHQGERGTVVADIQRKLGVKADGVFGLNTHIALTQFQKDRKLVADGIVGPRTWKALFGTTMPYEGLSKQLREPDLNMEYAARYLAWLKAYLDTDERYILAAAYNGGPANKTVVYMLKVLRAR